MDVMTLAPIEITQKEITYPESDGKPMADNTKQFRIITTIVGNLEILYEEEPMVLVVGDLLWYPIQGDRSTRTAPDAMVVFGRPKGDRTSYLQWQEEGIAPQVVFEILSPGNRRGEMEEKFAFYEEHGVEEYYLYDPDRGKLRGWLQQQGLLRPIAKMAGWQSPRLQIRFELANKELMLYYPDGRPFLSMVELDQARRREAKSRIIAETRAANAETRAANEAKARVTEAKARAVAEARVRELEALLKAAGLL